MDVFMCVTSKLRNQLTDQHETWHVEVFFFSPRSFSRYPFCFYSLLGSAATQQLLYRYVYLHEIFTCRYFFMEKFLMLIILLTLGR